ncbi:MULTISPECIES: ABC transporter substrate-binding protein [unclassified Streptomyces]|uniref:ABC transporter substrate-binding protein n=1 Tax=unclassified Streptomyces TaxID=2593676 RepID=UPI003827A488
MLTLTDGRGRHLRRGVLALTAALSLSLVAACGGDSSDDDSASAEPKAAAGGAFPVSLKSAWGSSEVKKKPVKVATVSDGDTAIALALGVVPVITPDIEDGDKPAEYKQRALDKLGVDKLKTYDDTDGTAYEDIAAEAPDIILGVNTWEMDKDYAKLSPIAPVVTYTDKAQADTMTWQDRLKTAAKALGLEKKAEEVIAATEKTTADAAAAHPEFKGKTYTYAVSHPEQISFMSYADQDPGVFEQLGFTKTDKAKSYGPDKNGISLENLDQLDADVLLVSYPFGDRGVISPKELENNKLFKTLGAVKGNHYAVIPSDNMLAAALAYPDALSAPWVVEQLTPILAKAVAGK